VLAAVVTLLSLGTGVGPAYAYTCPNHTICFFQGENFNGNVAALSTQANGHQWVSLLAHGIPSLPWGSVNNNSDSCARIGNSAGETAPILPHVRLNGNQIDNRIKSWRWVYIFYGNSSCPTTGYPPPP